MASIQLRKARYTSRICNDDIGDHVWQASTIAARICESVSIDRYQHVKYLRLYKKEKTTLINVVFFNLCVPLFFVPDTIFD
jgi:hypothetical protein